MSRTLVKISGAGSRVLVNIPATGGVIYEKPTANDNRVLVSIPGPAGPPGPSGAEEEMLDTEVDQSVPGVVYVGEAVPGTNSAASLWRIKRITESGSATSVDWAGGTAGFVHSWDDRLTLTYGP
jgi:hypothetical protein